MILYKEFLNLNENDNMELDFQANEKLRKSVYEIVVDSKNDEHITFEKLSSILKDKYKIYISSEILKTILDDWNFRNNFKVFKKEDEKWLDVWAYMGYIKRKTRYKQNFGKHRWKNTTYEPYKGPKYPYPPYYGNYD